jgi:hypothetical protein
MSARAVPAEPPRLRAPSLQSKPKQERAAASLVQTGCTALPEIKPMTTLHPVQTAPSTRKDGASRLSSDVTILFVLGSIAALAIALLLLAPG